MATVDEIIKSFKLILGAGLDYPPTKDEVPDRLEVWCEFLTDIPGDTLLQAAKDIVISGEKFPSISRVREAAKQVKIHNNTSAAPNPFAPLIAGKEPPRFFRVTAEGWQYIEPGKVLPTAKQTEYRAEYDRMMAEEAEIQSEIAAYLAKQEVELCTAF